MPGTLLKERLWHKSFPVNFAKFLIISFSLEHLQWLLLRRQNDFRILFVRTVCQENESILYLGPDIWDTVLGSIKKAISLNSFKSELKNGSQKLVHNWH